MGQISMNSALAPASLAAAPVTSGESRALNRAAFTAVQQLNSADYAGDGREVTFSVDRASHRPVIKLVDTATREIIQQWPLEYVLQLAAGMKKQV